MSYNAVHFIPQRLQSRLSCKCSPRDWKEMFQVNKQNPSSAGCIRSLRRQGQQRGGTEWLRTAAPALQPHNTTPVASCLACQGPSRLLSGTHCLGPSCPSEGMCSPQDKFVPTPFTPSCEMGFHSQSQCRLFGPLFLDPLVHRALSLPV